MNVICLNITVTIGEVQNLIYSNTIVRRSYNTVKGNKKLGVAKIRKSLKILGNSWPKM